MTERPKKIAKGAAAVAAALVLIATGCNGGDKFLSIDPTEFNIDASAQSLTAGIAASSSWYPYSPEEWIIAYPDESDLSVLHIEIPEEQSNQSLEPREGLITIITGDGQTATIRIRQAALDVVLTITPSELQEFDGKGGEQTLSVTSQNISDWAYSTSPFVTDEWLTVTRDADLLTVAAAHSNLLEPRRDTIFIYPAAEELQSIRDTIPIVQAAVKLVLLNNDMSGTTLETGPEGAEIDFTVVASDSWTVTADNDAVPSEDSGDADTTGEIVLTVTIPENLTAETVTYTLTFNCGGEEYAYTIVQSPAESGGE